MLSMLFHFHYLSGNGTAVGCTGHTPKDSDSRILFYHYLWACGDLLSSGIIMCFHVTWCKEISGGKKRKKFMVTHAN